MTYYDSWEAAQAASTNAIECPGCKRISRFWLRYYDRHNIYSGRACSDECARVLPGQGDMRDYDAEEAIEPS